MTINNDGVFFVDDFAAELRLHRVRVWESGQSRRRGALLCSTADRLAECCDQQWFRCHKWCRNQHRCGGWILAATIWDSFADKLAGWQNISWYTHKTYLQGDSMQMFGRTQVATCICINPLWNHLIWKKCWILKSVRNNWILTVVLQIADGLLPDL